MRDLEREEAPELLEARLFVTPLASTADDSIHQHHINAENLPFSH
jgi:hypothetical protein